MNINILPSLLLHYVLIQKIGEGGNSKVWSVKSKSNNLLYACKIPTDDDLNFLIIDEANIMSQLSSPFLTFYGLYKYNNLIVLVSELFDGKTIYELTKFELSEAQILSVAISLLEQLSLLHKKGFNHGDISNGNILYNSNRVVFIDVTNQKYYPDRMTISSEAEVTRSSPESWLKARSLGISPELLYQKKDIFEFGEVIRELVTHENISPWHEFILNPDSYKISTQYPKINYIVNSSMNMDITQRPSADDLLNYLK